MNNLVVGKMKDGLSGVSIKNFLELKAQMYTYITKDDHEYQKTKDICENVVDDELKYEDYKKLLFIGVYMRHEINRI